MSRRRPASLCSTGLAPWTRSPIAVPLLRSTEQATAVRLTGDALRGIDICLRASKVQFMEAMDTDSPPGAFVYFEDNTGPGAVRLTEHLEKIAGTSLEL